MRTQFLNQLCRTIGYEVHRNDYLDRLRAIEAAEPPEYYLARRLRLIAHRKIDLLLDVGANIGQFVKSMRGVGFSGRIISFEPLHDAFLSLQETAKNDPLWDVRNYALGERDGVATINVSGNSGSSSLLPMLPAHERGEPSSKYFRTEEISIHTLDTVLPQVLRNESSLYLKIDAQGYEQKILEGAASSLAFISVVQLEASLCNLYEGAPLAHELIQWMKERDFVPVSIEPGWYDSTTGREFQVDIIFWRDSIPSGTYAD